MAITLTCDLTSAQDDEDILMALTKAIQQHLMKHHQFPGIFPDAEPLSEQASFNHALDLLLILPYEIEIQLIGGPKDSKIIDKLNQWLARPEEKAGTPASQRVKFPIKITRRDDNTHSEPAAAAAAEAALAPWQTQLIPALVANVRTLFQESNPPGNNNASAHHLVNQALPIIMSADFLTKNLQDIINAAEIPAGNLSKENQNFLDHCRVIYFLSMMSILLSSGKQDLFLELLNEVDKIITTHPQDPIWESMACHAQIARGHTLTVKGQFYAALEGYTKLLNTLVQLYGPQYCRVIAIEKSILETTLACGKIDEKQRKDFAEQYQQNIAKTEQWYGDDHLEVVTAWGAKAKFLASGKDREDARDLFLKEKYWYEAKNKCKTAGYAGTINNLASIYADLKEFTEALPLYQSAVEV